MARIATFGNDEPTPEVEVDTFEWYGEEIRLNPEFSELDYLDYMEEASTVDERNPRAVTLTKHLLRCQIHPEDFERFWQTTKRKVPAGQQLRVMMEASAQIITVVTGRPTGQPSASSAGPPATVSSLRAESSLPVGLPPEAEQDLISLRDQRFARLMAENATGRPDIGQVLLRRAEVRSGEQHAG